MRTIGWAVAGMVLLAVLVAVVAWVFWLRPDAAEEVSLEDAVEDVASAAASASPPGATTSASETSAAPAADGAELELAGTWRVQAAAPGDPQEGEGTFAGYRIDEELAGVGANTVTGRTDAVDGVVEIEDGRVVRAEVSVDVTSLRSDQDLRDRALATRGLEYEQFPSASFELTSPVRLDPDLLASGESTPAEAVGALTLHGRTNVVTIPLEAQLVGERLVVVGSTRVRLEDYGIEAPTGFRVLDIAETGVVELQLILRRTESASPGP